MDGAQPHSLTSTAAGAVAEAAHSAMQQRSRHPRQPPSPPSPHPMALPPPPPPSPPPPPRLAEEQALRTSQRAPPPCLMMWHIKTVSPFAPLRFETTIARCEQACPRRIKAQGVYSRVPPSTHSSCCIRTCYIRTCYIRTCYIRTCCIRTCYTLTHRLTHALHSHPPLGLQVQSVWLLRVLLRSTWRFHRRDLRAMYAIRSGSNPR